ncbi:hypothetical protein [Streptomyces sp. NPDC056227]|uniref:hypothetical protein n=1 Tax=Streptomyces sp. NPDC056227 TaxID=3345753 RepID=UPI0035D54B8F
MRPSPDQLLASLRLSLNETLLPKVEDRWARYVGTAMDLVIQHLQLRLAGEMDALDEDSADMAAVLAAIGGRAAALGAQTEGTAGSRWAELAELLPSPADGAHDHDLGDATARNERLRGAVVAVMRWLDEAGAQGESPAVREMRDEVHQLVRRQVDRTKPLVAPLFMSFGPVAS